MTHCRLNLFVFIYSPRPTLRRAAPRAGRDLPESLCSAWQRGGRNGGEIISSAHLAKEKSAERSSWHRTCVTWIFKAAQVSARASHQHPVPHQHSTPHSTDRRVEIADSSSYTVSSAGEREKEKIKGWEAQMVSLGTINGLIKGH